MASFNDLKSRSKDSLDLLQKQLENANKKGSKN